MKPKIQIVLGSTREGRSGAHVAKWVQETLRKRDDAKFEFLDLQEWKLPFFEDSRMPGDIHGDFPDPKAKEWSKKIKEGDGYLVINPEYNRGYSAVLKNSMDYLFNEWNKKPIGFVSYGNIAGGARAVEQLKLVSIELEMIPIRRAVHIPNVWEAFDENGNLKNSERFEKGLHEVVDQLLWYANLLKPAREALQS